MTPFELLSSLRSFAHSSKNAIKMEPSEEIQLGDGLGIGFCLEADTTLLYLAIRNLRGRHYEIERNAQRGREKLFS